MPANRKEPPILLSATEPPRAFLDFAMLAASAPWLAQLPRGDGHGVIVMPGMLASDWSTATLRRSLNALNYNCVGWGLGTNLGFKTVGKDLSAVDPVVKGLVEHTGGRKVSLIGTSLGGMIAREFAKREPQLVRQVITIGSPFNYPPKDSGPGRVLRSITGQQDDDALDRDQLVIPPAGIPSTAIYSPLDGVVAWRACLEPEGELTENIAVWASHLGLAASPAIFVAIADRLAQEPENWVPFDREANVWRKSVFPEPAASEPLTKS